MIVPCNKKKVLSEVKKPGKVTFTAGQFFRCPALYETPVYEVLHEVQTITICLFDCNGEMIFVSDEICAKMPQKPNCESRKIQILGGDGINSKLKLRNAQYSILSWRFCVPYRRAGDWCCIQENWHVCQGWYWHIIKLKEKQPKYPRFLQVSVKKLSMLYSLGP